MRKQFSLSTNDGLSKFTVEPLGDVIEFTAEVFDDEEELANGSMVISSKPSEVTTTYLDEIEVRELIRLLESALPERKRVN